MPNLPSKIVSWYFKNSVQILLYSSILFLTLLIGERIGIIFSYTGEITGIDNNFDYPIIRSLAGYSMYPDPEQYPYVVNPYAPLFFIICKAIAQLFNISVDNTIAFYHISKGFSFFCDLGTLLIAFSILKNRFRVKASQALILISMLMVLLYQVGFTFNRADSLLLFWYACTLSFLISSAKIGFKVRTTLLIAIFSLLAIFSKQNGIILFVLCNCWFFLYRQYRHLIIYTFTYSALAFALYYYFEHIKDNFFLAHIFHALQNRIDLRWAYVYVFKYLISSPLTLVFTTTMVAAIHAALTKWRSGIVSNLSVLFFIQFLFSSLLCFKWGSSAGYYNEALFISFILLPAYLFSSEFPTLVIDIKKSVAFLYPAFFIFSLHIFFQLHLYFNNHYSTGRTYYKEQQGIATHIRKNLKKTGNYAINLANPNVDYFKNMLYEEMAAPNFDAVDCCTLPDKNFDYSGLIAGFKNGKIQYIIGNNETSLKELWGVSLEHYKKDTVFNNFIVYKYTAVNQ